MAPPNLRSDNQPHAEKRRVLHFSTKELLLQHGVVHRIEFRENRCHVTLKNTTPQRQSVNLRIYVLNKSLIELWAQSERWLLKSLQPDLVHLITWDFRPAIPDVIWNERARDATPEWIIVDLA